MGVTSFAKVATRPGGYMEIYPVTPNMGIVISANGNVGIGTTGPVVKLHINEPSINAPQIKLSNTNSGSTATDGLNLTMIGDITGAQLWFYENGYLRFATNSTERFRISAAGGFSFGSYASAGNDPGAENMIIQGKMGIGTASPTNKLEVDGGSASTRLRISTTHTGTQTAGIILANSSKTAFNDGLIISHGGGYTRFDDLVGNEIMRLTPQSGAVGNTSFSGNVGIGIAEALEKLHVAGTIRTNHEYERNIIFAANWAINDYIDVVQVATGVYGGLYEVSIQTSYASFAEHATFMVSGGHAAANAWRNAAAIDTSSFVGSGMNFTVDANGDSYYTKFRIRAIKTGGSTGATVMFKVRSIGNTSGWTTLTTSGSNGSVSGTYSSYGDSYSLYGGNASVGAGNLALFLNNSGNVGIGTTTPARKLSVNGAAGGTAAWYNDSDERLKKNIVTIPHALERVQQLRGVNFEWKETSTYPSGNQMGFIAQEALPIIPEVVSKPGEYYSMAYSPITALLTEAIKAVSYTHLTLPTILRV